MLVTCTKCGKTLKVPDNVAGKKIRCPSCSGIVDVPAMDVGPPTPPASRPSQNSPTPPKEPRVARPVSAARDAAPGRQESAASRPSASAPTARSTSGSRGRPPEESRAGSRGGQSARSGAGQSARGRRLHTPVEDYDDDSGYDSFGYGGGGGGYDDANPFAAPQTRTQAGQSRTDERNGRQMTGIGLLMQGWAFVYVFLTLLGTVGVTFLVALANGGQGEPPAVLALLLGLALLGNIVAGLVMLIGQFLCLAIPSRSGAKGWVIGAIASLGLMFILFMTIGISAQSIPMGPGFGGTSSIRTFANAMVWIWMLSGLAWLICYELFLRQAALYLGRDDLAKQALIVLIGVPIVMAVQFVFTLVLGLLVPSLGVGAGIMMLGLALVVLIAMIVFAVMHVALLFRLGSAMRA